MEKFGVPVEKIVFLEETFYLHGMQQCKITSHLCDDDVKEDVQLSNLMTHLSAIIPPILCPTRKSGTDVCFSWEKKVFHDYHCSHHEKS